MAVGKALAVRRKGNQLPAGSHHSPALNNNKFKMINRLKDWKKVFVKHPIYREKMSVIFQNTELRLV